MSKTTDILKTIQPQPHEQWNGNLGHRKTIQSQREQIDKLQNELDFEILHKVIANEELRRVQEQLDHKSICFRTAMSAINQLEKLHEKQLAKHQDLIFNLGDQIMGLAPDPDQPFKQPEMPTKPVDTFMSDYMENHPGSFSSSILMSLCPDECGYEVEIKNKACKADYVKEACEACWNQPLEVEK